MFNYKNKFESCVSLLLFLNGMGLTIDYSTRYDNKAMILNI